MKNMGLLKKSFKIMTIISILMLISVNIAFAEWGPTIPAPPRDGITHTTYPNGLSYSAFNNYIDGNYSPFEDERAFSIVMLSDGSQTGDSVSTAGGEYMKFRSYINNNGSTTQTATNTKIRTEDFYQNNDGNWVSTPFNANTGINITQFIEATNSTPISIWDTATITSELSATNSIRLKYIVNASSMFLRPISGGTSTYVPTNNQTDFFDNGLTIGDKNAPLSGNFQGGDDNRMRFEFFMWAELANADLSITKSSDKDAVNTGENITYTLNYANTGPIEATGVTIIDNYDETRITINTNSLPAGCIDDGSQITCVIADEVANGANDSLSYTANAIAIGVAENTASISSAMGDTNTANNSAVKSVTISESPIVPVNPGDIIINELLWNLATGANTDKYIELRNMTDSAINLTGLQITKNNGSESLLTTVPSGTIPANGFYLISYYNADNADSKLNVNPDLVTDQLIFDSNDRQIKIYNSQWNSGGTVIDTAGDGINTLESLRIDQNASLSRKWVPANGTNANNWFTSQISKGFDDMSIAGSPGNSSSTIDQAFPETVYEDGISADNWTVYDNDPAAATVTAIGGTIITEGQWILNGYKIDEDWQNDGQMIAQWKQQFNNKYNRIYISLDTNNGHRFLQYVGTNDEPCSQEANNAEYITCGLGNFASNEWQTITRNLKNDLTQGQGGTIINAVKSIYIRGNGKLDDIKLLNNIDGYYTISGNIKKNGVNLRNAIVNFGGVMPSVRTGSNGDYSQWGFVNGNYTVSVQHSGSIFEPDSQNVTINNNNATQNFTSTTGPATIYEDGEDASDWIIYDNTPDGATAQSSNGVIVTSGDWILNGYQLGGAWNNNGQFVAQWTLKMNNQFNHFYWKLETNQGLRFIKYVATSEPCQETNNSIYIVCGLGEYGDDNWYTITRNLETDLATTQPDVLIYEVNGYYMRGNGSIDNIILMSDMDGFHRITGNVTKDDNDLERALITFDDAMPPVRTDANGNYEQIGFTNGYYTVSVKSDGTDFNPDTQIIQINDNSINQNFAGTSTSATIYEDGNDASDWTIYDNNPPGAISVLIDGGSNGIGDNAIQLTGTPPEADHSTDATNGTGFMFSANWQNNGQMIALWDIKTSDDVVIYFQVVTSRGTKYVEYNNFVTPDTCITEHDTYIICGLPANTKDGNWHTITKNLEDDFSSQFGTIYLYEVIRMMVRGNMLIDNIRLQ